MGEKITMEHLERSAYVYVRQSSLHQGRHHRESRQRQYAQLEARWNEALTKVAALEHDLGAEQNDRELTDEQKHQLRRLGHDLPALWSHPRPSDELKKRILRTVLHEIVITDDQDGSGHVLQLHWQGGTHTELHVRCNRYGAVRARSGELLARSVLRRHYGRASGRRAQFL